MPDTTAQPPARLVLDPTISNRAFRVWCWLDHMCRARGGFYPTKARDLARQVGVVYKTAERAILELEQAGWIYREWPESERDRVAGARYLTIDDPRP